MFSKNKKECTFLGKVETIIVVGTVIVSYILFNYELICYYVDHSYMLVKESLILVRCVVFYPSERGHINVFLLMI